MRLQEGSSRSFSKQHTHTRILQNFGDGKKLILHDDDNNNSKKLQQVKAILKMFKTQKTNKQTGKKTPKQQQNPNDSKTKQKHKIILRNHLIIKNINYVFTHITHESVFRREVSLIYKMVLRSHDVILTWVVRSRPCQDVN